MVLASGGYPNNYKKGYEITGDLEDKNDSFVFHAGTIYDEGKFYTSGGRVLCVSALGSTLEEAIKNSYERIEKIHFKDMHYRKDIGKKGLNFNKGGVENI